MIYLFSNINSIMHHSFITKDNILNKLEGMLFINKGKICYLGNISGHYKTEAKQMDLFLEKVQLSF